MLSIAFNGLREEFGDLTIYADRVPTEAGRRDLEDRLADLRRGLTGATDLEIRKSMARLASVLVSRTIDADADRDAARQGAIMVLGECPAWAIDAACLAYMRGEAGDCHWMPTPAEIRQAAKRRMQRYEEEARRIEKVLTARVVDAPRFA